MDIGDHLRTGIAERDPGIPGFLEKTQIFRAVHARPGTLAKDRRFDQRVLAGLQSREQSIGALGLLGGAPDDAPHQEELRIVAAMQFGVYGLHTDTYSTDSAGLSRSGLRRESDIRDEKLYAPAAGRLAAAMATIWDSRRPIRDGAPRRNERICFISHLPSAPLEQGSDDRALRKMVLLG